MDGVGRQGSESVKEGGLFLAKFLIFAAISLVVFSFALKPYAYVLMYVSDAAGRIAMGYDISERRVEGSGVGTEITFVYRDETRRLPAIPFPWGYWTCRCPGSMAPNWPG